MDKSQDAAAPTGTSETPGSAKWPYCVGFWWGRDKWDDLFFVESFVDGGIMKVKMFGGGSCGTDLERHDFDETGEFFPINQKNPFQPNDTGQPRRKET